MVSVVLCTYSLDMFEHFCEAAESVLAQRYEPVELVVIVDGSEAVVERVDGMYGDRDDVVLHKNDSNVGLLESRNTGVKLARGDVVAFIDDDAIADEQWIETLISAYEEQDAIAVGGMMVPEWVDGKPSYLPEEFYFLVGVTHRGFAEGPGEVRNTFGSNISFRRDVFLELDGFDSAIGGRKGERNLQGGETELCARMYQEYCRGVWYAPEAKVAHKVFGYRTKLWWLVSRAFWQGYSKRAMERILPGSSSEEAEFLRAIFLRFVPGRLRRLVGSPSLKGTERLVAVCLFTGIVVFGYLFATVSIVLERTPGFDSS